jgi:micrococcal nuclease
MRLNSIRIKAYFLLLIALAMLAATGCTPPAGTTEFKSPYVNAEDGEWTQVTRIVDGDTIYVNGDRSIRYIGVDTPETKHPSKGKQPYGPEATEANRKLVEGRKILLVKDVSETDRYNRLLRYIFLEDGTFVNLKLVEDGYARVATFPPDVRFVDLFLEAERKAREEGRGLWGYEENNE